MQNFSGFISSHFVFNLIQKRYSQRTMASVRSIIERMSKDDIVRSIVVSNIPPGTKDEALVIHFQRRKHGGGDVSSVNMTRDLSEHGATAVVTFEDAKTLETVLTVEHKIEGHLLKADRCPQKRTDSNDEVFSQVTAKLKPPELGMKPRETKQILDRLKTEVGISFERSEDFFMISGSLNQINNCHRLLKMHFAEEELDISDKVSKFSFENDQAGQRVVGKANSTKSESSGIGFARATEGRPAAKVRYVGGMHQEDTKLIGHPPKVGKQMFKAKSYVLSFIRQRFNHQMRNIEESCVIEVSKVDELGRDTEVTLKPRSECDPSIYFKACSEFSKLLETASQGMVTWEVDSTSENESSVVSLVHYNAPKFPVILDKLQENGPLVVYGDAASVERLKTCVNAAINELGDDNPLLGTQLMTSAEPGSLSIETCSHHTENGINISLRYGDIASQDVDAIVNPANDWLVHGAGLANFIVQKGGDEIVRECRELMKTRHYRPLNVGDAVHTKAGNLPCKFIIHAVGPEWNKQSEKETVHLLQKACFQSLNLASTLQLSSIALPAMSSGVFGAPIEVCAFAILNGVQEYLEYVNMPNAPKRKNRRTKKTQGNGQKKEDRQKNRKKQEDQTKEAAAQAAGSENDRQKPRLQDIRVVLIDADAMDVFLKEFMRRFGSGQTDLGASSDEDESL